MRLKLNYPVPVLAVITLGGLALLQGRAQSTKSGESGHAPALAEASVAAVGDGIAHGPEFQLGIGDVIHVSVWRQPELTQTAIVRPDGRVSLPLAGEVPVAGKTTIGAQSLIRSLLLRYVTEPEVTVSVVEIHSRQVFITGQVQRPGAYPLIGSCNVLQLIASAGGLTPYAHKKHIVVLDARSNPIAKFDYSSAVKGDARQTRDLQPGETVVVP